MKSYGEMTDPARYDYQERYELSLSVIALVKTERWHYLGMFGRFCLCLDSSS